jgi:NAD(P)H-hydrate epimerase
MTVPLECDSEGKITIGETLAGGQLHSLIRESNCVAIGPGLGRSRDLQKLVANVVESADCPIVIDADGLNNLADAHIGAVGPLLRSKEVVLTPHPGEWSRLVGVEANNRAEQRAAASRFASEFKTVVVLKGTQTTVTDGRMTIENTTGTPAMATGGSGDVLTGIVAAAICQGMGCLDAARFAVYVHGLAGQIAERETGHFVVPPPTLIHYLSKAMAELNHSTEC